MICIDSGRYEWNGGYKWSGRYGWIWMKWQIWMEVGVVDMDVGGEYGIFFEMGELRRVNFINWRGVRCA